MKRIYILGFVLLSALFLASPTLAQESMDSESASSMKEIISVFRDRISPQQTVIPENGEVFFRNESIHIVELTIYEREKKVRVIKMKKGRQEYSHVFKNQAPHSLSVSFLSGQGEFIKLPALTGKVYVISSEAYDDYTRLPVQMNKNPTKSTAKDFVEYHTEQFVKDENDFILGSVMVNNWSEYFDAKLTDGLTTEDRFGYGNYFEGIRFYASSSASNIPSAMLLKTEKTGKWKTRGARNFSIPLLIKKDSPRGNTETLVMVGRAHDSALGKGNTITFKEMGFSSGQDGMPLRDKGLPITSGFFLGVHDEVGTKADPLFEKDTSSADESKEIQKSVPLLGSITVAKKKVQEPLYIKRGQTEVKIGSLVINITKEGVNASSSPFVVNVSGKSSGIGDGNKYKSYFRNIYLGDDELAWYGKPVTVKLTDEIPIPDSFGVSLPVSAGTSPLQSFKEKTFDIYADVLKTAPIIKASLILDDVEVTIDNQTFKAGAGLKLQEYRIIK